MPWIGYHLHQRYIVAILATTLLMVWLSVNEDGRSVAIPTQFAFWAAAVSAGWLQMILISRGIRSAFGHNRWPGWVFLLAAAFVGAVPLSFEVRWLLESIIAPPNGLPPVWLTYLNVSVINTVFGMVQYILIERWPLSDRATSQDTPVSVPLIEPEFQSPVINRSLADPPNITRAEDPDIAPDVSLLSRVPKGLSGKILYLKMEDHYLNVHTDHGKGLALLRLSDAKRELQNANGRQVHKSWWVAKAAVSKVRKQGRSWIIVTTDGTEIPVGRSFESTLRETGWI